MARIPVYGQQVTPNASGAPANAQGARIAASTGAGFEAVGQGLDRIAGALERREQVDFSLEKDRIETEGRIWAARAASQADLDMAGHLQESQKTAPPGASGFTPSFLKRYDEYSGETEKNAPSQFAKQLIQSHLLRSREAYGKAAMIYEAQEFTRFQGQQVDEGVNMSASLVSGNPAWFEREMGKWESTIRGIKLDEGAKQKMRDLAKNTLVGAAVKGWIDQNPREASQFLEAWQKSLKPGDKPIVEMSVNGVATRVPIGMADFKQQQALIEYARQKSEGLRQEQSVSLRYDIQDLEAMAATGVAPTGPVRSREEFTAAFKNPEVADREFARYQAAYGAAQSTATLRGRSSADLLQLVQQKPPANDPNFAVTAAALEVQQRAAVSIVKARQDDPVAYAMTAGDFGLQPLNPQNPDQFAAELKRRTAALPTMAEKYGRADVLSKPEATALARNLEIMPADQRVAQLQTIRKSVGDDMVYATMLNSIRPDSPVTALVGNVAAAGATENARLIAIGEDLINPTKDGKKQDGKAPFPLPSETMLRQAWVDSIGEAYRGYPQAESTAYQAFKAYYAAVAAQKGLNDPKAAPDDRIVKDAINASTGGVMRWKTDMFGNSTPSANIVLPYGMPGDVFRDRVSAEWLRVREKVGYSKTDVGDIGLYNTGANGEYMVMSGTSWLPGKDGKPIILRVNVPAASGKIGGR